jgi:hypothetical protein
MAIYNGPPTGNPGATPFKPIDWDKIAVPIDSISGGSITAVNTLGTTISLPGELLDFQMKHDLDYIRASGLPEEDLNNLLKKEMATKLAQKMMDDGHILFTKQTDLADNSIRYRAYTWVGNKDFIEQQRKNKR